MTSSAAIGVDYNSALSGSSSDPSEVGESSATEVGDSFVSAEFGSGTGVLWVASAVAPLFPLPEAGARGDGISGRIAEAPDQSKAILKSENGYFGS